MKSKIEIKSIFGKLLFEFETENNTIAKTIHEANLRDANLRDADLRGANLRDADIRDADLRWANLHDADLRWADLRWANLRGANLRGANLRGADLRGADLRGADLRGANLRDADLRGADLCGADTSKRYIQISCIGSSKRMTTYCFEDDIIWCGCFKGSLKEFEDKVNITHRNNEIYLKEYIGFINYLKSLK